MAEGSGEDASGRRATPGGAGLAVADRIIEAIREAAAALIEEQKARIADSVRGVAEALQQAADRVVGEGVAAAQCASRAAGRIDAISARLRDRPVGELVAEAEDFARGHPVVFLLGAVLGGFALGRLVVASGSGAAPAEAATSLAGSAERTGSS